MLTIERIPATAVEEQDEIRFIGAEELGWRRVLDIKEEPHVRVLTLDGPPIPRAGAKADNVWRLRKAGQFVDRRN